MTIAQPKSAELLDLLLPSLTLGQNQLSELKIHSIIREAKKIPFVYQSVAIEGLARLVMGDIEYGSSLCERAIALAPDDSVSFCNFATALRNKGYHVRQYEVIKKAINSRNPRILKEVAVNAAFWLDLELLREIMPVLNAMEVEKTGDLIICNDTLDYLERNEAYSQELKAIGKLMMEIADKYHFRLAGSHSFYVSNELNTLFIEIKTDDPILLSRVNDELADDIISAGLENSECVGCFQAGGFDVR